MIPQRANAIQMVPIDEIKLNPKNRNKHPEDQIDRLIEIIRYQGFRNPLIVSTRTGMLVAGHGRMQAARKLGMTVLPVIHQEFESEEQEIAAGVSDNAIALWAELDLSGINSDIGNLGPDFDIDLLGIKNFEIEVADKHEGDPDEVLEAPAEPKSKLGDLWTLGEHRLMCGDSTSIDAVEKLMNGEKASLIATDPPYGMDLETDRRGMGTTTTSYSKIIGDAEPFDPQHIIGAFPETPMILWSADYYCHRIPNWSEGSPLVWAKAHSEEENKVWGSSFETAWVWPKKKRTIWFIRRIHMSAEHEGVHPTQKPIEITTRAIEMFDIQPNGVVVDLYGGSGSTLIACEKTGRKCFMMELDPRYCDVILNRWAKLTGKDPVRDDETKWSDLNGQTA